MKIKKGGEHIIFDYEKQHLTKEEAKLLVQILLSERTHTKENVKDEEQEKKHGRL